MRIQKEDIGRYIFMCIIAIMALTFIIFTSIGKYDVEYTLEVVYQNGNSEILVINAKESKYIQSSINLDVGGWQPTNNLYLKESGRSTIIATGVRRFNIIDKIIAKVILR